jgi:hypothetical protein
MTIIDGDSHYSGQPGVIVSIVVSDSRARDVAAVTEIVPGPDVVLSARKVRKSVLKKRPTVARRVVCTCKSDPPGAATTDRGRS